MNTMLNRAMVDFEDFWSWPWLVKTTTGAAPLTISDLRSVLSVYDANGVEMFGATGTDDIDVNQIGTPSYWWIDDTSGSSVLRAWPVGTVSFSVRYLSDSSTLTSDTDTPKIPARYHPLWIDMAVVQAYRDSDNFAAAQALQGDINQRLQALVERYETRNRMNSQTVLVRMGSEDE